MSSATWPSLFRLRGRVDQNFLDELEHRLYLADVGTAATADIVGQVRQAFLDKEITGDVEAFVKQQLRDELSGPSPGITFAATGRPSCWSPASTAPARRRRSPSWPSGCKPTARR